MRLIFGPCDEPRRQFLELKECRPAILMGHLVAEHASFSLLIHLKSI